MLLNSRMASIPCSPRHSLTCTKDIESSNLKPISNARVIITQTCSPSSSATKSGLQYFNMRVTQRLRHYRSMKKHWQELATSVQNTSLSPTFESPVPQDSMKNSTQKSPNENRTHCINDYINTTATIKDYSEKNSIELDPLHSRIEQDLMKLRKFMKKKQRKQVEYTPSYKITTLNSQRPSGEIASTTNPTALDEQEPRNITIIRRASSISKLKPLDRVKIAGCPMRSPILSKSDSADSGVGSTSNASSTCSQYSKQQKLKRHNANKTFNIYRSRVNALPLPPPPPPPPPHSSESFFYRSSYFPKKKFHTSPKMSQSSPSRQSNISTRLPISLPSVVENKSPTFIKQETPLPPIRQPSQHDGITTRLYTYAASTSSATPRSMMLKRNTSLLPILLQSSSCMGIQQREIHLRKQRSKLDEEQLDEEQEEFPQENDDYHHLLNYNHLINRLPKPIISIVPRYGQDDYGILFEQLDHIRETMPDSNIYDDYARII